MKQMNLCKHNFFPYKKLFIAAGLSMLIFSACGQENTKRDDKPNIQAEMTEKENTTPQNQAADAPNPESGKSDEQKHENEQSDSPKVDEDKKKEEKPAEPGDNAVKNPENVPMDTPDNISEQRQIVTPLVNISTIITPELREQFQSIDFSLFNLDVTAPKQITDIDSLYVLANKANYFPENFKPKNLVVPKIPFSFSGENEKKYLQKPAADAITTLIDAASADGIAISGVSGYRSIARQKVIYKYNVDNYGQAHADKYSAKPQYSEHHTGLCMDVSSASVGFGLVEKYGDTKEGKWLANNAHKYGFVIRYPKGKESITGYSYEPWHIRYLGVNLATFLYNNGLCYEEFISGMQNLDAAEPPVEIPLPEEVVPAEPSDENKQNTDNLESDEKTDSSENTENTEKVEPTENSESESSAN